MRHIVVHRYMIFFLFKMNGPEILLQFTIKMNPEFDTEKASDKKRKRHDNSELFMDSDTDDANIMSDQKKKTRLFNPILVTSGVDKKENRKEKNKRQTSLIKQVTNKIEKISKRQGFENNRIFSNLTDEEKEYLRSCWAMGVMFLIEESCKDFRNQMLDVDAAIRTAQEELDHMSFLQTRAIYVALVQQKNLFITGDAGTGKTRVLKFIMAHYHLIFGTKIVVTASTGKAALELRSGNVTGKTIHSAFRLGTKLNEKKLNWKLKDGKYREWLGGVKALIIDECSMVNENLFDSIVYLFKRAGNGVFKSTHFIVTGDFFQLPPVTGDFCFLNDGWYSDTSRNLLRSSWKEMNFTYIGLTEVFRQKDPEFKCHCTNLRYGFFNESTSRYFEKCKYSEDDAVRLFAFKKFRDRYNDQRIDLLPGNDIMIRAFDTSDYIKEIRQLEPGLKSIKEMKESSNLRVRELVEKHLILEKIFTSQTQSEYEIRLRLNCRVMVIQNCSDEVANGTSGIFVGWRSRKLSDVEKTRRLIGCHVGLKYRELDMKSGERYQDHDMIVRLDDTSKEVFIEFSEMSEEDSE